MVAIFVSIRQNKDKTRKQKEKSRMEIRDGYMPFMGYQTYYRMVGNQASTKKPLVLLHGGPGSTHNYFEVLDA